MLHEFSQSLPVPVQALHKTEHHPSDFQVLYFLLRLQIQHHRSNCLPVSNLRLPNKTIYISHQNDHNYADLLNGALYGFDFDLTESEILLYNASKLLSPLQRIEKSFHKL